MKLHRAMANTPILDMRQYLCGRTLISGVSLDVWGRQQAIWQGSLVGRWEGDTGMIEQEATCNDGRQTLRTWKIKFLDQHHCLATTQAIVAHAQGFQNGNHATFEYTYRDTCLGYPCRLKNYGHYFLVDTHTVVGRCRTTLWGIPLSTTITTFYKQ